MERTPRLLRRRRGQGGMLLGLCAGIGAHLGVDPVLVRFALVAMTFLSVAGLAVPVLYLLFAICVPYEET